MTKFVKKFKSEKGFTLIELIASLTVLALVVGIIYSVMMFGLRSYHKVQIENSLREEADIMMSSIISELYVFGPESVSQPQNEDGSANVSKIELKRVLDGHDVEREIMMDNGKLFIRDLTNGSQAGPVDLSIGEVIVKSKLIQPGSEIKLTCSNIDNTCKSGLIEIKLILEQTFENKGYPLELNSRFGF